MPDILTITTNPAIDIATTVDRVVAGPKLRCKPPRTDPGGGGVNVARAIGKLGGEATTLVAVGGTTGEQLLTLLAAEGVPSRPVHVSGETRQSFAVTDEKTGEQYRFGVPGQPLTDDDADNLIAELTAAAPQNGYVVFSGSVAPGLPDDFPSRVQAAIAPRTQNLIIDTSSTPLAKLIENPKSPIFVLRVDQREAAEISKQNLASVPDNIAFARSMIDSGVARVVVIGRGAEGSILTTQDQQIFCHAPHVPIRSKIGAGDSFVGALTLALAREETLSHALQLAVATASATVMTEGTELCKEPAVRALLSQCTIEAV